MTIRLLRGDCRATLPTLLERSVQAICTSPPYWGLRSYGTPDLVWGGDAGHEHVWAMAHTAGWHVGTGTGMASSTLAPSAAAAQARSKTAVTGSSMGRACVCGAWLGSLGLEPTPELFIEHLVECFRHVRRVLKDDGVVWLNLGDSYAGSGKGPSNSLQPDASQMSKQSTNRGSLVYSGGSSPAQQLTRASGARMGGVHGDVGHTSGVTPPKGYKPKDLLMIPARVAMALQQPYVEPYCVKSEIDRSWLAAMFDGEGTIGIRRFNSWRPEKQQVYQDGFVVYTSVANSDVELLDHCVAITGYGRPAVKSRGHAGDVDPRGVVTRRDSYGWRQDGNAAVDIIRAVYPYLIAKRKQAILAYTLDCLNKGSREVRGRGPVPEEEQAKRALLYDLIKRCNQREAVDLPSWVEEPRAKVEPGWWLRSMIPWLKRNSMPESVTDRPATAVEYVFLLAKSRTYFWDADAVRRESQPWATKKPDYWDTGAGGHGTIHRKGREKGVNTGEERSGRNWRNSDLFFDSWQGLLADEQTEPLAFVVNPAPYKGAHYATFPPKLVEPMILAGTRPGDTVLDPFGGSGTTGMVADRLGRNAILCELSADYGEQAVQRVSGDSPMFAEVEVA